MARHKRSVWDELRGLGRRIMKELDDLLDLGARSRRAPAPAPVPVAPGERRNKAQNPQN